MDSLIQISKINDFLYCPVSIYLHSLYENFDAKMHHQAPQVAGKIKHENIEEGAYSTSKKFIMAMEVGSEKYGLVGKIDIYDSETRALTERKTLVKKIYEGYKCQLYAQYFCMTEMGYPIKKLFIHSLADNKRYEIPIPDGEIKKEFEDILERIRSFDIASIHGHSCERCRNSVYGALSW